MVLPQQPCHQSRGTYGTDETGQRRAVNSGAKEWHPEYQAPKSGPDRLFPFHLSTLSLGSSPCDEGCRPAHTRWVASEKSLPRASSWIFMFLERKARGEGREMRAGSEAVLTRAFLLPHVRLKKGLELGVTSLPSYPLSLSLSLPGSGPQFLCL